MSEPRTVNPGVTTWVVVLVRCTECGKPGPTVEKQPGAQVRVTFTCSGRKCGGYEQRQLV